MYGDVCRKCFHYQEIDDERGICKNPYLFALKDTVVDGSKRNNCYESQYDILERAGEAPGQTKLF